MSLRKVVGKNVAARRKKDGISQQVLAKRVCMNKQTVWRIEAGANNLTIDTLERFAEALEVSPVDLLLDWDQASEGKGEQCLKLVDDLGDRLKEAADAAKELAPAVRLLANATDAV